MRSLDRHPLHIKQLKDEEPVEVIDLSGKRLTQLSAIVIASLIRTNTATTSLKYAPPLLMTDLINCQQPLTVLAFLFCVCAQSRRQLPL